MIICHPLKLIFLKTKKVGGTSFEIALSSFCGPDCVITPISPNDEQTRQDLGYKGAQNYENPTWPDGTRSQMTFYNHMSAAQIQANIPRDIWETYQKISMIRDPYDGAISRYCWEGGPKTGLTFGQFVGYFRSFLSENTSIAPTSGPHQVDRWLRYESLQQDITSLNINGLWDRFSNLRTKSNQRPTEGYSVREIYAQFPEALQIIAKECRDVINLGGYQPPKIIRPNAPIARNELNFDRLFTISAGRTATAWLAKMLGENLGVQAVHEPLGITDFGTKMPDIQALRTFNTYGMDHRLREFWPQKLQSMDPPYIETNHTLAKCGLIEGILNNGFAKSTVIVILRRNLIDQCVSYIMRGDFQNVTVEWQWYLSPNYPNVMIDPKPFIPLGQIGRAIWYCYEMEARQEYYLQKHQHQIRFIEVSVEEISKPNGAKKFLEVLGYEGSVYLPPKENANQENEEMRYALREQVELTMGGLVFDAHSIAASYIRSGRDLAVPTLSVESS
ncbi:MAG: hypothetical protein ABJJ53_18015 [Sulfitobacter sp.]